MRLLLCFLVFNLSGPFLMAQESSQPQKAEEPKPQIVDEKAKDGGTISVDRSGWKEQGGYSLRPFAGLGGAGLQPVENANLGTGIGLQLDVGLLNEMRISESMFFRLRPSLSMRSYDFEIGSAGFSYYNLFFRLGLGGKLTLSRRWAIFLDVNPQFALGRGYCSSETGETTTYQDDEWDWDEWDFTSDGSVSALNSDAFNADRDRICGDLTRNLNTFQLGLRAGANLRLANRIVLEGYYEKEAKANESRLLRGDSYAIGVNFNFIVF